MTSYRGSKLFIEEQLTIITKQGKEIPFALNNVQAKFVENATGRDIILKARQMGFSSFILGAFAKDFILKENSLSIILADNADNAKNLLARVKHFISSYERKNKLKIPLKYNSKFELQNAHNGARYIIGTAQNEEFGRSQTITNLHLSEASFYPNFSKILAAAGTAAAFGRIIIETTANGFNDFKEFWDRSQIGETPFKPHFFSAEEFYDKDFLEGEKGRLGRLYIQEYPSTPEEAFLTSGDCFFEALYINDIREKNKRETIPFQFINNI
jgi:hypothetical protein